MWRQVAVVLVALAIPAVVYAECNPGPSDPTPYYPPPPQVAAVNAIEGMDILVGGTGLTAGPHSMMAQAVGGYPIRIGPLTSDGVADSAGNLAPEDVAIPLGVGLIGTVYIWLVNDLSNVISDAVSITIGSAPSKPQCVPPYRGGLYKYVQARVGCQKHHMPSKWAWTRANATTTSTYRWNCTPVVEMLIPDHGQTASWGNRDGAAEFRLNEHSLITGPVGLKAGFADAFELAAADVRSILGGAGAARYGPGIIEARAAMNALPAGGTISC